MKQTAVEWLILEMNKTELEEVAKKLYPFNDGFQVMDIDISEELQLAFINGAKWQQDKYLYSEEDMKLSFEAGKKRGNSGDPNTDNFRQPNFEEWFEQFKKK